MYLVKKIKAWLFLVDILYMNREYDKLESYQIVVLIKQCKGLLETRPAYQQRLKCVIKVLRDILIERATVPLRRA